MEIEDLIKKMKVIHSILIDFIDTTDDFDVEFKSLINILDEQEILQNQDDIRLLFQLISKITDNHHRTPDFFDKCEFFFQYLIKDIPSPISNFISDYTNYNQQILFLLLRKGFVNPDESFLNQYLQNIPTKGTFSSKQLHISGSCYYLYPIMKKFLEEKLQKQIEKDILDQYGEEISTFEEKCQIGENDSYICSLIRSDSVEEFISYVNRTNLSLLAKIKPSLYETNSFLIDKEPTLIEYAAFYGSIQIIQYLKYNNVPLPCSLWLYVIHSNNAELIHFLEENKIKPKEDISKDFGLCFFNKVFIESIKCHHIAISNYIKDNLYEQTQTDDQIRFYDNFSDTIANSLNFSFFPNIESIFCRPKNQKGFNLSQLCFSLKIITIPYIVTSIKNNFFKGCSLLTKIIIPSSVTSIEKYSFSECSSLTQISIPSSITSFGENIFDGIKTLEITGDINYIPNKLFSECSSLTQITLPSSVKSIGDYVFYGCSSLAQITIPSSLTSIGDYVFYGCSSLTQITIPSSLTSIGDYVFSGCSSLIQITIPSSITKIGNNAFSKCSSLSHIQITSSVSSIGNYAFSECSSLKQISIPSSVSKIGNFAFFKCTSITQISFEMPSSVTSIGNNAFSGCTSLTQISIPSSLTLIGKGNFSGCSSLTKIYIPSSITSIGDYVFNKCSSLTQIIIPSSVTSIGDYTFSECTSLTRIVIPSSVTFIGKSVFNRCSSLIQITIPSSTSSIGDYTFSECSSLTQITIPSSVTSIGKCAFRGCSSLAQIVIPSSVTSIESSAFI